MTSGRETPRANRLEYGRADFVNRSFSTVLVILIILCGCYWPSPPASASAAKKHPAYEDSEGYALLSLALLRAIPDPQNSAIYINEHTSMVDDRDAFSLVKCVKLPPEFREAADDYLRKGKTALTLRERFVLGTSYSLLSASGGVPKLEIKGSKKFIGTFDVSAVGFDQARTRAVLRINNVCGSLCGGGNYYFFLKGENGWEEVKSIPKCTWVY